MQTKRLHDNRVQDRQGIQLLWVCQRTAVISRGFHVQGEELCSKLFLDVGRPRQSPGDVGQHNASRLMAGQQVIQDLAGHCQTPLLDGSAVKQRGLPLGVFFLVDACVHRLEDDCFIGR